MATIARHRLLLSQKEAMAELGITTKLFLALVRSGELPFVTLSPKRNALRRFAEEDIVALIKRRKTWLGSTRTSPKEAPTAAAKASPRAPKSRAVNDLSPRTVRRPELKLVDE